jgi:hypothetical protein
MLNYVILWEDKVDSNDTLYFGDTLFHKDLADITTTVVNMLVTLLDQAADKVRSHTRQMCAVIQGQSGEVLSIQQAES